MFKKSYKEVCKVKKTDVALHRANGKRKQPKAHGFFYPKLFFPIIEMGFFSETKKPFFEIAGCIYKAIQ